MVMIRKKGKAQSISEKIMKRQGIKIAKTPKMQKSKLTGPYLQH